LEVQHASKLDVVVPARDLVVADGNVLVTGAGEPVIPDDSSALAGQDRAVVQLVPG
jgi:hypothetical protein